MPEDLGTAVLAIVEVHDDGPAPEPERYLAPFIVEPGSSGARVATVGDGVWRALAVAIGEGRIVRSASRGALVCRPGLGLSAFAPAGPASIGAWEERPLGADQSNTSAVLGERLLLKAYRRVVSGLNPDLELIAFLAEERGSRQVPALGGSAEYVAPDGTVATIAMLQELVPDAEDAYESTAERLAGWIAAPGVVALEYATEDAAELGTALAELHASLADGGELEAFATRSATSDDLSAWRVDGEKHLEAALEQLGADDRIGADLRAWAPAIRERLAVLETISPPPLVARIHGDLHLGQVLRRPDGFVFVDFEGEPLRPIEERRGLASPMRDLASLLLSFDHVSSSAERRALAQGWMPGEHAGLDIAAWRRRSRERLLRAYGTRVRRLGAPIVVDERLIDGLAVAKECVEFVYAATYLPEWLFAPHEGMARLLGVAAAR